MLIIISKFLFIFAGFILAIAAGINSESKVFNHQRFVFYSALVFLLAGAFLK